MRIKIISALIFSLIFGSSFYISRCKDGIEIPVDKGYPKVTQEEIYEIVKFIIRDQHISNDRKLNSLPIFGDGYFQSMLVEEILWDRKEGLTPIILKDKEYIAYQECFPELKQWDNKHFNFKGNFNYDEVISFSVPLFSLDKQRAFVTVNTNNKILAARSTTKCFAVIKFNNKWESKPLVRVFGGLKPTKKYRYQK